jgi:hypothetical protein
LRWRRPAGILRLGCRWIEETCRASGAVEVSGAGVAAGDSSREEQVQAGMMAARTSTTRGKKERIPDLL